MMNTVCFAGKQYSFLVVLFLFASCTQDASVGIPEFSDGGILAHALPIARQNILLLNGVYDVVNGSDEFGKTVVIKTNDSLISIFTGKNAALFVLRAGSIDSSLHFEGYWRYTQSDETGLARFEVGAEDGGTDILQGKLPLSSIVVHGTIGNGSSTSDREIVLRYQRPLQYPSPFWIIAHRGGGRNSDRLPESENSLGIIIIAESFGANAIEIDVRLTKDGIPILFHDDNFSPRLIDGEYCIGPVANYSFASIRTLCTLKNGERIPTLREALDCALTKTNLSLVWLDLKSPEALAASAIIQKEYKQKALALGRNMEILLGLPTDELVDAYKKQNLPGTTDALCELGLDDVHGTDARVWAPRWTLGPMSREVEQLHGEGKRTFVWTLDQPEFIRTFLMEGKPDGILTNYPSLVAYEYYIFQ